MKRAFLLGLCPLLFGCATRDTPSTVAFVDPERYQGQWHEVARIPNWFQRRCHRDTTATYSLEADGRIRVVNACRREDGRVIRIEGTATPVPGSGNAKLKVRFFGPFAGDYWILGLDENHYAWAVVGHPSRNYLWFLSRSPQVDERTFARMASIAAEAGYDLSRLQKSR